MNFQKCLQFGKSLCGIKYRKLNSVDDFKKCLQFGKSLCGIKYRKWQGEDNFDNIMYCNGIPDMDVLRNNGINCTGLMNLIRQYNGLPIPEHTSYRGGTLFWYEYFSTRGLLDDFDYCKSYPEGTLLLRNYRNLEDQGHVAIIIETNEKMLYGKILHSYCYGNNNGVSITNIGQSHFCIESGYYEYVVLPEHWLA